MLTALHEGAFTLMEDAEMVGQLMDSRYLPMVFNGSAPLGSEEVVLYSLAIYDRTEGVNLFETPACLN